MTVQSVLVATSSFNNSSIPFALTANHHAAFTHAQYLPSENIGQLLMSDDQVCCGDIVIRDSFGLLTMSSDVHVFVLEWRMHYVVKDLLYCLHESDFILMCAYKPVLLLYFMYAVCYICIL